MGLYLGLCIPRGAFYTRTHTVRGEGFFVAVGLGTDIRDIQKSLKVINFSGQNLLSSVKFWSVQLIKKKRKIKEMGTTQMQGCTPELEIALIQSNVNEEQLPSSPTQGESQSHF